MDEMALALLSLTMFDEDQNGARTWKRQHWVAMDWLHAKGYISDPKSTAKSVVVTAAGMAEIPRTVRETLREERTVSAPAVAFADVTEPFLSGKRVRAPDHGPSSPVPPRARNACRLRFAPGH